MPPAKNSTTRPEIYDTGSVSSSGQIKEVLAQIREEAAHVAMDETQRSPDASGIARQIEFMEVETPILSLMAFNRESAENQCLTWACQLFGTQPSARGHWNKKIDLQMDAEDWLEIFDAAAKADARSTTLTVEGLRAIARDKGLVIEDEKWNLIEQEIKADRDREAQASAVDDVTVFD